MRKIQIFRYTDYRKYVRDLLATYPKSGHGQFSKIAKSLRTNTVTISQIFSGKREMTSEQSLDLAQYLGLGELEARYLMVLVQRERTSYHHLRAFYDEELKELRRQSGNLKKVVPSEEISDEIKAIFYSDWAYSAVRLLCPLPRFRSADQIADFLKLSRTRVLQILEFLTQHHLLILKGGKYELGPTATHLEAGSPFVKGRQISWRVKATEFMDSEKFHQSLFYTAPFSISKNDYSEFREELVSLIQRLVARVGKTEAEQLACLNIDFYSFE